MKYFARLTLALACFFGLAVAVNAQDTITKEKVKVRGGAAQTVSYTGCVATGSETTTYVLNHVVPVSKTVENRSGAVSTTTTSYVLVPGSDTVTFTKLVGHKVEVTGVMIPGGKETKVEKKTKGLEITSARYEGAVVDSRERAGDKREYPATRQDH